MSKETIVPLEIKKGLYRHFKGGLYEVVGTVIHSETLETMVLYRPFGTQHYWVRPYNMFTQHVEKDGYSGPRFVFEKD